MALEIFTWCTQVQNGGAASTEDNSVREVSFGNGYSQAASAGFNVTRRSFSVVYAARDWAEMLDFCRKHTVKPFAWRTPEGDLAIFRVKPGSISGKVVSREIREITCTFREDFTSVK